MVECDYCDASFEGEDGYLAHLRDAHEGELGSIDQRRVDELEGDGGDGVPTGPVALGFVLLVALGMVAYVTLFAGGGGGGDDGLPAHGVQSIVSQVQTEQATSTAHVASGTEIDYATLPPASGTHYPTSSATSAGFYETRQPLGGVVHSLEHGAVVVWYDPSALTPEAKENLTSYANTYTRSFGSFIAVPTPVEDPDHPYVLTAWEHRLALDAYSQKHVRAFTAEYLGRGPEGAYR